MGIFSRVSIWIPYIHLSHLGDGHVDFLVVFGYPKMIEFARLIGDAPNEGILGDELFPADSSGNGRLPSMYKHVYIHSVYIYIYIYLFIVYIVYIHTCIYIHVYIYTYCTNV